MVISLADLPVWFMQFTIYDLFTQWEYTGIFDLLLPFLLLFALIFGILSTTNVLGSHKGVNVIIAFTIALMSLRFYFVSDFFADVFPRLGIGLAMIVVLMVLVGLFIPLDEKRYWSWGLGTIGFAIAIIVVVKSLDVFGWTSTGINTWDFAGWIVGALVVIGLIIAVAASSGGKSGEEKKHATYGPWWPPPNNK